MEITFRKRYLSTMLYLTCNSHKSFKLPSFNNQNGSELLMMLDIPSSALWHCTVGLPLRLVGKQQLAQSLLVLQLITRSM